MMRILSNLFLLYFLFSISVSADEIVLSDDFESGLSLWQTNAWGLTESLSVSPTHSFSESPTGNYPADTVLIAVTSSGVDLTGFLGARLEFWASYDIEPSFDFCDVDVTREGIPWVNLGSLTGSYPFWQLQSFDVSGFAGQPDVRFRFRFYSDQLYTYDGLYIDDFTVIGEDEDTSGPFIIHIPPDGYEGSADDVTVLAVLLDPSGISENHLFYRLDGCPFQEASLLSQVGERYYYVIPAQDAGTLVEYYFEAADASVQLYATISDTFAYLSGEMLIYDDGLSEMILQVVPGDLAAVRFTRQNTGYIASAVLRFYTDFLNPLDSIRVSIWDDYLGIPGTLIAGPFDAYPFNTAQEPEAWTWIDLRPALQLAPADFHIVCEVATTGSVDHMALPYDSPPVHYRSSVNFGAGFEQVNYGDFHIRAVVGDIDPDELLPPTDLSGSSQGDLLLLTWSPPEATDDMLRYEIERQGEIIGQTIYQETEFTDTLTTLPPGLFTYRVRTIYSTGASPFCDPWDFLWDSTGVENEIGSNLPQRAEFSAFPVPTNGNLTVSITGTSVFGNVSIFIFDLLGREVWRWDVQKKSAVSVYNLSLPPHLAAGVYILESRNDDLIQARRKIVYLP